LQDLELDIPDAAHFVALFLGRAIVDEVLPPAFLTKVLQRLRDDSLGVQVVRSVGESAAESVPFLPPGAVV
jgi:programmed cell death protein 4